MTTSAVIVISSNIILVLGMVGALLIVRFRMAIKEVSYSKIVFYEGDLEEG